VTLQSNILEEWESASGALCRIIEGPWLRAHIRTSWTVEYIEIFCKDYADCPDIAWSINGQIYFMGASHRCGDKNRLVEKARDRATKAGNEWLPDFLTKGNDD
jgi:hypothetical protein